MCVGILCKVGLFLRSLLSLCVVPKSLSHTDTHMHTHVASGTVIAAPKSGSGPRGRQGASYVAKRPVR